LFFKPTFIREEFTFEAINSGKYDKFYTAAKADGKKASSDKKTSTEIKMDLLDGEYKFEDCFCDSIYQDYLLLSEFFHRATRLRTYG
jgi:hypothetical protein